MISDVLEPFVTAVATAFRESAGMDVTVGTVVQSTDPELLSGDSVFLRLEAEISGWLVLCVPSAIAAKLARRVLGEAVNEVDADIIQDCLAELLNVIAGQAKALTFGSPWHFSLSTPTAI